ncbi:MAG: PLP-dependent aminotransferase family protein [Oscillospiraceae bacterium]|nr:PLP-dependent aminotransferase family protein [Oscillospiraceae bacterium]
MDYIFSNKISSLKPSAIREILKVTSDPSFIPFAAGNPAPEAFPTEDIRAMTDKILRENPVNALQYGVTEGYPPLREAVREFIKDKYSLGNENDSLIITSGAQQVMDLATKALCNEGDTVICESPSFIGSLNCFRSYSARLAGVRVENDGMDFEMLEQTLKTAENARFIYTIPNFQNPSGVTMSLEKRKKVYELALKYGVLIVEDNPYGDLRVSGVDIPSIKSFDTENIVIYAGSFSKILSPGLRVGFALAPSEIIAKMVVCKQTSDVHTPLLNQMLVYEWLKNYAIEKHLDYLRGIYKRKLDLMCEGLDSSLSGFLDYQKPEGGLFIWCSLPENAGVMDYCKKAAERKVAMVPGSAFLTDANEADNHIRLNFSTPTDENIVKGINILKDLKL